MKILLAAVNAKYIHSNLAIYSLKAYAEAKSMDWRGNKPEQGGIELAEYTINQQRDDILMDIYRRRPDVACFSCYIWNLDYVEELVEELGKIRPDMPIWLGGPEVSYDSADVLRRLHKVKGVMKGEGEETFAQLSRIRKATRDLNERRELPSGKKMERLSRIHGARQWILARFPLSTATWKHSSIRSSTMRAAGGAPSRAATACLPWTSVCDSGTPGW